MTTTKKQKPAKTKPSKEESHHPVVHLVDFHFLSGDWQIKREELGKRNQLEIAIDTDVVEQDARHSFFIQKFKLNIKPENVNTIVGYFNCSFVIKCTTDEDVPVEFWQKYQKEVLPVISVPFFREYVFSLSGKMGIAPIIVPHWMR